MKRNHRIVYAASSVAVISSVLGAVLPGLSHPFTSDSHQPDPAQVAINEIIARVQQARACRDLSLPGHGDQMRRCVAELIKLGSREVAIDILDEVIQQPESAFDHFEALRMKGQYLRTAGNRAEARQAFAEALALADADTSMKHYGASYASVVQQYSQIMASEGDAATALMINERIASAPVGTYEYGVSESTLHNSVGLWIRAGDRAQSIAAIDRLIERYPNYGQDNGWGIDLRMQRAELVDPTCATNEYVQTLQDIWNSTTLHGYRSKIESGLRLAQSHRFRQEYGLAVAIEQEVVVRADAALSEIGRDGGDHDELARSSLESARDSALHGLSTAAEYGFRDVAIIALTRLRDAAVIPSDRDSYSRQIEDVVSTR